MSRASASRAGCVVALLLLAAGAPAQDDTGKLRDSGLIERTDTVLAQIDVTVIGAPEALRDLTEDDFTLKVNRQKILDFTLDRVCDVIDAAGGITPPGSTRPPADSGSMSQVLAARAHYLMYFDQPHLTMAGRAQALDTARELIPLLTRDGGDVMLVSNADRLAVLEQFGTQADRLLEALDELEMNRKQWSTFAEDEDNRVADVVHLLNEEEQLSAAVAMARRHHKDEVAATDRNMRRLRLTLTRLVDLAPPKAVIYFGDTLRRNPGEHYLSFFGSAVQRSESAMSGMGTSSLLGGLSFDTVVNEASAQGVRFYTIQAEGLMGRMHGELPGATAMVQTQRAAAPRSIRSRDARDTLRGLAAESGGESFVQGASAKLIGERILADSACVFLISFDPTGFHYDRPLRTVVQTNREDVELRVRGRLIVQSPSVRRTASLLRAFGSPDAIEDPFELRSQLVPTGFEDGEYTALLQLSVPGTPLQSATWELGASIVHRDKIHDEASGRLTVNQPGIPVVLEREMRFKPGEYEMVSVAHEAGTGMISSVQKTWVWPDPDGQEATIAPIALLQPAEAAFVRGEDSRGLGSLARASDEWVDPERPLVLVTVVCRGRRDRGPLKIDRELVGESVVDLPQLNVDMSADRCAQVRDLIPAATLGSGNYRYAISHGESEDRVELAFVEFSVPNGTDSR
jgi:VWFA-related protein